MEYFTDAVDRDDGVELVLRSGRSLPVPPGHLAGELHRLAAPRCPHPYEPFVSDSGNDALPPDALQSDRRLSRRSAATT